ncbi:MAG: dihydropteroate synthase [Candidatus Hodarchaeales archaeon]|jgi:dihydropteroate synthase
MNKFENSPIVGKIASLVIGDKYRTCIMGILNLSPSSFFKGSISTKKRDIQSNLMTMINGGADIIDVGALSSAPSFIYDTTQETNLSSEITRLEEFFDVYREIKSSIPISVDTQSHITAQYALDNGATIINDISGLKKDPLMAKTVSESDASIIMMACRKKPGDVFKIADIIVELKKSIDIATSSGIDESKIIVDPGLGTWVPERNTEHDFTIIKFLEELRTLGKCILVGISRKSFIGKIVNKSPDQRLWGSLAANSIAIYNGAHIIRTHDVRETKDTSLVLDYLKSL